MRVVSDTSPVGNVAIIGRCATFRAMSVLELKQELSRMGKRERQELHAYLIRLKHETPEWKRDTARRVAEMKKGRVVSAAELQAQTPLEVAEILRFAGLAAALLRATFTL